MYSVKQKHCFKVEIERCKITFRNDSNCKEKYICTEAAIKKDYKNLVNKRKNEITSIQNSIDKLNTHYKKESSDIKSLNIWCDSAQCKLNDWEQKKSCIAGRQSILESEAKRGNLQVSELINEISSLHNISKSPIKLAIAESNLKIEYQDNVLFDNKNDGCQYLNTQDSEKNKIRTQRSTKEDCHQFKLFSTFSDDLGDLLLANAKIKNGLQNEAKIKSHRERKNAVFMCSNQVQLTTKTGVTTDREINKSEINFDDTLSDVPVKDCSEIQDASIFNHLLDSRVSRLLEDIDLELSFEKDHIPSKLSNEANKMNTPSFKDIALANCSQSKQTDSLKEHNFENQFINNFINLCNIPEEIDENGSNLNSEHTFSKENSQKGNSKQKQSPNQNNGKRFKNEKFETPELLSCLNFELSPNRQSTKLQGALKSFLNEKNSQTCESQLFGDGERLTFCK